ASRAQTMAELRGWERLIALQLEYSLVTRDIEHEFVGLGTQLGMGVIAWSPLASGLLSGKYRPGEAGEGRLAQLKDSGNPAFEKFTERNWAIVAELERVAEDVDRSMAQVAMQWVARRPGVASVLIGASKLHQLEDNLAALDQELPAELLERLDAASVQDPPFPYTFFTLGMQAMLTGGATVGDEPADYRRPLLLDAEPAGVE
ncbi:MAG: aldo/keto reductase, partial [Acidobacteriota bacterium]